jgi:cytochrome P450
MREELGEIFLIISPSQIFMNCSNAEGNLNLTARSKDFIKPAELYAVVDIFGSSILSTEGDEWKRHRKIVAPAFAEKNNILVWTESLHQAAGMLRSWSKINGNTQDHMIVKNAAPATAYLALHVISGAGFGVRQLWDGENEEQLGKNAIPGFNTAKLTGSHTLTFKDALQELMSGMIWIMLFPRWLLSELKTQNTPGYG